MTGGIHGLDELVRELLMLADRVTEHEGARVHIALTVDPDPASDIPPLTRHWDIGQLQGEHMHTARWEHLGLPAGLRTPGAFR